MIIDGKYMNENELVSNEKKFLKKYNNIYISDEQKDILEKYSIKVESYNSVEQLIYDIEEYLNNCGLILDDLEWVSQTISEYNYYNNTNK